MTSLQRLLIADGAFVAPSHVLESLTAEQARTHVTGTPHSLYEELWHLDFWQRLILAEARGEPTSYPERAVEGWPDDNDALTEGVWRGLVERCLEDLSSAAELAGSADLKRADLKCNAGDGTVREELESLVGHNAYHLGLMVLLRQLLGLWPPPSGGDSW